MSRYKAYLEYKESNIGWMGAVPEGWNVIPCRAVVEDIAEKNVGAADQNYLSVMANIGVIKYEDKGDVGNKKPDDLSKCKIVKAGNLVINSMNYAIGSYGMSPYNGVCSPVYIVLGVNEEAMESRFALRIFENTPFQKYLATFGNGILEHRAAIGWDDIKGAHVPLPSKAEQRAILNFLDHETAKIDALIEKQQRLIELLKEKRQAVISHAVTKGLNPNAPMKDSGVEWLGEVPAHWDLQPLKYLCTFSGGGTPSKDNLSYWTEGNIPWVSPKDMKSFWISDSQDKITQAAVQGSSTNFVDAGALLIVVRSGILQRTIPIAINTVPVTLNQDMKALSFISEMNVEFAANFILGNIPPLLLEWSKEGATVESIEHEYLSSSVFPVPPYEEQCEINAAIRQRMESFDALEQQAATGISLLQERRTALISAAVTGKIDVRDWQPAAAQEAAGVEC
jgi:type I restriction enzyme S subunit